MPSNNDILVLVRADTDEAVRQVEAVQKQIEITREASTSTGSTQGWLHDLNTQASIAANTLTKITISIANIVEELTNIQSIEDVDLVNLFGSLLDTVTGLDSGGLVEGLDIEGVISGFTSVLDIVEEIKDGTTSWEDGAVALVNSLLDAAADLGLDELVDGFDIEGVISGFTSVLDIVEEIKDGTTSWEDGAVALVNSLLDAAADLGLDELVDGFDIEGVISGFTSVLDIVEGIKDGTTSWEDGAVALVNSLLDTAADLGLDELVGGFDIEGLISGFTSVLDIVEGIKDGTTSWKDGAVALVNSLLDTADDLGLGELVEGLDIEGLISGFTSVLDIVEEIKDGTTSWKDGIFDLVDPLLDIATDLGLGGLVEGLDIDVEGLISGFKSIWDTVEGIKDGTTSWEDGTVDLLNSVAPFLDLATGLDLSGLIGGLDIEGVISGFKSIWDTVEGIKDGTTSWEDGAVALLNSIVPFFDLATGISSFFINDAHERAEAAIAEEERIWENKAEEEELAIMRAEEMGEDTVERELALAEERLEMEKKFEKQREDLERKKFEQEKAISISEAIIYTAVGVANALATQNWIGAALIAASGAVQIGLIASESFPGLEGGGIVPAQPPYGGLYHIGEHEPEAVIPLSQLESGGGGGSTMVVNIAINGNLYGDEDIANRVGDAVRNAIQRDRYRGV